MSRKVTVGGCEVTLDGNKWLIEGERIHEVTLDRFIAAAQAAALERIAKALEKSAGSEDPA